VKGDALAFAAVGGLQTIDTLASNMQTVAQYGEDRAFEDFQNLLDAHNRNLMDMQDDLVERTTERLARYGSGVSMSMEEHDENGFARPQRVRAGSMVGFPLRSYLGTLQWNRKYFLSATVAEFAAQITSMFTADIVNVGVQIKTALFTGTNYGWNDYLVDNLGRTLGSGVYLPVKALVNADSGEIPVGPNGETFNPATHTHYLGSTSGTDASAADLTSLVTTVVEHYAGVACHLLQPSPGSPAPDPHRVHRLPRRSHRGCDQRGSGPWHALDPDQHLQPGHRDLRWRRGVGEAVDSRPVLLLLRSGPAQALPSARAHRRLRHPYPHRRG
jgi:hypothetical protein